VTATDFCLNCNERLEMVDGRWRHVHGSKSCRFLDAPWPADPYYCDDDIKLYRADALTVLASLPDASVDALVTDPPYSSGGFTRGDRTDTTTSKYVETGSSNVRLGDFAGDNRDQRGYAFWCCLWMGEALRVVRPGGVLLAFTDWRQLPVTTDIIQAAGWVWRGIVPWFKPSARPTLGRFTANCEYVVWASSGQMSLDGMPLPGFYQAMPPRDREHITQKPLSVMRELVKIAPKGGLVLDPFMGSGTTGVAAVLEGRKFIGCELTEHYAETARTRITASIQGYRDDGTQGVLEVEEGVAS
jgi:site-specific DNA-methyltransferase (adenine-specific)